MDDIDLKRLALETVQQFGQIKQFRQIKTMLIVVSVIGVFSLVLGGVALYLIKALTAAGTEPPIRVKGGSIHFDVLGQADPNNAQWYQDGTAWSPSLGDRNGDKFGLFIVSNTDCEAVTKGKASVIFTYTNDTDPTHPVDSNVVFVAKAKGSGGKYKTAATPDAALNLYLDKSDGRKLSNVPPTPPSPEPTGFVSHVKFGSVDCSFKRGEFEEAFIFEW